MIMGMILTNDFKAHITVENMKSSMLDVFVGMFNEAGITMAGDSKDFVIQATEQLMRENKMDSSLAITKYKVVSDTTGEKEFFVSMDEFDEVSDLFRTAIAKLMLQVISYELAAHIEEVKKEG